MNTEDDKYSTSSALLEQLVYIDNFMSSSGSAGDLTPNLDMDGQLSMDLAAFADDSFIFPDEEKPKQNNNEHNDHDVHNELNLLHAHSLIGLLQEPFIKQEPDTSFLNKVNVLDLPKFPVPPGAKSSLESAGLSQNQIDLLSALIAQHQTSLGNSIPNDNASKDAMQKPVVPHLLSQASPNLFTPVRQHNQIPGVDNSNGDFYFNQSLSGGHHPNSSVSLLVNLNSPMQALPNSSEDTATTTVYGDVPTPANSNTSLLELDKRRRNTAALARFRIKKKLKEKQMENQLHSLNNLIKDYESKVQQLEMENKLLRNLIVVKGTQKSDNELKLLKERAKLG